MLSVLDRKLIREVRASGSLLIAITSVIAVGVMCFIYMKSAFYNLDLAKEQVLRRRPDGRLLGRGQKGAAGRARSRRKPAGRHRAAAANPFLRHRRSGARAGAAQRPGAVAARPAAADHQRHRRSSAAATSPSSRENEVIVNDAFAREHDCGSGEWIHLLLNNRRQELFVVGTAISCEFVYLVGPARSRRTPSTLACSI